MTIRFKDLLNPHKDSLPNAENLDDLKRFLPDTPLQILKDFYSDHGRKEDFQIQYGNLEISKIKWEKRKMAADILSKSGFYPFFSSWIHNVKKRITAFRTNGWSCIDDRQEVVTHWQKFQTWMSPPIFLEKNLITNEAGYWLVEGHTRIGILIGLVENGVIEADSIHEIWLGSH